MRFISSSASSMRLQISDFLFPREQGHLAIWFIYIRTDRREFPGARPRPPPPAVPARPA